MQEPSRRHRRNCRVSNLAQVRIPLQTVLPDLFAPLFLKQSITNASFGPGSSDAEAGPLHQEEFVQQVVAIARVLSVAAAARRSCRRGGPHGSLTASVRRRPEHLTGGCVVLRHRRPLCCRPHTLFTAFCHASRSITAGRALWHSTRADIVLRLTGVDLGLVGVEDRDARRIARMSRSRAQGDAGRQGSGPRPGARSDDGGQLRLPPREAREPYPARQQPPRQWAGMRDQQGNGGQRFGASAEAAMPRLPSPRWSGQGRILGRPDIKVLAASACNIASEKSATLVHQHVLFHPHSRCVS